MGAARQGVLHAAAHTLSDSSVGAWQPQHIGAGGGVQVAGQRAVGWGGVQLRAQVEQQSS